MTELSGTTALMVQLPTKLAVMSEENGVFSVSASMRTGVGGVVVPYFERTFDSFESAAARLNELVDGWPAHFSPHPIDEGCNVLPAAIGQTPDGETLTLVYFEEGGWICFDSLDPDGIYADWDAFEPALSELIDAVFNPA